MNALLFMSSFLGYIDTDLKPLNLSFIVTTILDYDWFFAYLFVLLSARSRGCPVTDMQLQQGYLKYWIPTPYHARFSGFLLNIPYSFIN